MALSPTSNLSGLKPGDSVPSPSAATDSEFLVVLGKRVREIREQRGMARKLLAREASVSERYLTQLEAGEGNISIMLLRRVALSLGVSLVALLDEDKHSVEHKLIQRLLEQLPEHRLEETVFRLIRDLDIQETARKKRVALIGMRGAGKSTLGSLLANKLHLPFVELDREIERESGIDLNEIFSLYGQNGYRRMERRSLTRIIQTYEQAVISVGGGIVSEPETYGLLLSSCYTIWLKTTPEEHMARVAAQGDFRPMEGHEEAMKDLRRILSAREMLYGKADAVVDTSGQKLEESLTKLRQAIVT